MLQPNHSQALWKQITADYRQAWLLRRQGQEKEATQLLEDRLPALIAAWSNVDTRSAVEKKSALNAMFDAAEASVDAWLSAENEIANRLGSTLMPVLRQHVAEGIRDVLGYRGPAGPVTLFRPAARHERVRFDDIPAVIDFVLSEQRADCGCEAALSY